MANRATKYPFAERATKYARAVVAGRVDACLEVRLACDRHLSDLKRTKDKAYPWRWDKAAGDRVCQFAEMMPHVKGKWAGQPLVLEDWQCFCLAVPFGWVGKESGLRRFTEVYEEIPRKNSKSTLGAVVGLYLGFMDGEPGSEVYSGATKLDQALEVFRPAWNMAKNSPDFRAHYGLDLGGTAKNPNTIFRMEDGSRFEPVVGNPGDGASPHGAIIDEYHEHRNSDLYDTMQTGMGSRQQPMLWTITTAGTDTSSPCYELRGRLLDILKGTVENDTVFGIIYGIDPDDDWTDFKVWRKANPNLGVSVFETYLKNQLKKATQSASQQNIIITKHLNRWTNAGAAWMNMVQWGACARPGLTAEEFAGRRAWLALDLASKIDLAALVAAVELDKGWAVFCRTYIPEATAELPHNAHYRAWGAEGWLTITDGARTDFRQVEEDAKEWAGLFGVQELCFDPREASLLIQDIQEWASFECVEIPQSPAHISEPMKELEGLVAAGEIIHDDNPVMNWMMGNVVLKQARGGGPVKHYYPTKERDGAKIDGPVALIMALKRGLAGQYIPSSVYEERGVLVF